MSMLYVSLAGQRALACYRIDPDTGDLSHVEDVAVPGEPSVQGRHPLLPVLYVGIRSTGHLLSFQIDGDGRLHELSDIDTGLVDPAYLATDRAGRFLLTPYYESARVTVYPIGQDGGARGPALCVAEADAHAHGLAVDPGNRFVFVSHACPGNSIRQFALLQDGTLRPNREPKVECPPETGPRHIQCHPTLPVAYADNEQGNSVSAYALDTKSGTLRHMQTLSTLPDDFRQGACARLELHPSGRFLYAANRGHDSLALFAIDPGTGELTARGRFATEANPRSFHMEPKGRYLYAAGQSADRLTAYCVDPGTGDLETLRTYVTGHVPWWVQTVEAGA